MHPLSGSRAEQGLGLVEVLAASALLVFLALAALGFQSRCLRRLNQSTLAFNKYAALLTWQPSEISAANCRYADLGPRRVLVLCQKRAEFSKWPAQAAFLIEK